MTGYLRQYPPALQIATFFGLFIGFSLLYGIFLVTVFPYISGYTIETLQSADPSLPKVLGYLKLTQFLYTLVVYMCPAALFAYLADPSPVEWMHLQQPPRVLPAALAILVMFAALPVVGFTSDWNHTWHLSGASRQMEEQAELLTRILLKMPDLGTLLINLVLIAILPAIAEEFFFRGVIQRLFIQVMPKLPWIGITITAVIFSAIHMEWLDFIPRIILGFLLGAIYYLSGNLWLSILGHFLNNGMQVVMVYLYQAKLIHDDPMQSETTAWYSAVLSLIITVALLWYLRKRSDSPKLITVQEPKHDTDIKSIGE
jgi:membrane protease YdiL (CAAX protease family)